MGRILLAGLLGLIISAGFSSCKKDWSCSCTDQNGNTTSVAINDQTILNARNKCQDLNYNHTVLGITTSENCSLQ